MISNSFVQIPVRSMHEINSLPASKPRGGRRHRAILLMGKARQGTLAESPRQAASSQPHLRNPSLTSALIHPFAPSFSKCRFHPSCSRYGSCFLPHPPLHPAHLGTQQEKLPSRAEERVWALTGQQGLALPPVVTLDQCLTLDPHVHICARKGSPAPHQAETQK